MALAVVSTGVREKPLDAFAGESADGQGEESANASGRDEGAPGGVRATADVHPEGATCEACGATVERRWQQGDAMVCPDCKDWSTG